MFLLFIAFMFSIWSIFYLKFMNAIYIVDFHTYISFSVAVQVLYHVYGLLYP